LAAARQYRSGIMAPGGGSLKVDVVQAFGSRASGTFRDPALFGDEAGRCLVVPVGRHVALKSPETGESTFLLGQPRVDAITACGISREKGHLAVCEHCQGAPQAQISIYDLKQETLSTEPLAVVEPLGKGPGRIMSVAFSAEGQFRYLCMICVASESSVVVWDWKSDRSVASHPLPRPVDRISFAPHDAGLVSVSGPQYIRLLRLSNVGSKSRDATIKVMQPFAGLKEDTTRFNDHCWTEPGDGTLVCCTQEGALYVLDSSDMVLLITLAPAFQDDSGVLSLVPLTVRCFSQGFIAGGAEGTVSVWEKVDGAPSADGEGAAPAAEYKHARTVQLCETDASVCCVDFSGSEELVAFSFQNGEVAVIAATQIYSGEEIDCHPINGGFHGGPVLGIDLAAQRPLAASVCKKDYSVRIWNYQTRTCELRWSFREAPLSVAMHPLGYLVAVSFSESIGFYHVLLHELRLYRQVPAKSCQTMRFAHGGHVLAASLGNEVLVIGTKDFRPCTKMGCGEGDSATFTALCFDLDDGTLLGGTAGGRIVTWNTATWEQLSENTNNSRSYLAAAFGPNNTAFCGAAHGSKCFMERVQDGVVDLGQQLSEPNVRSVRVTAICCHPSSGALFLGTSTGSIWCFPGTAVSAFQGDEVANPEEVKGVLQGLHSGACNCLRLTSDGRTLLSAGDDGAIFVGEVYGLGSGDDGADSQRAILGATETVLIDRAQIQQRKAELNQLREEHAALTTRLKEEVENLRGECDKKLAEARQQDQAEIKELRRRCSNLNMATIAKERESKRTSEAMDRSHAQTAEQLSNLYEKKLEYECDRYVSLELDHQRLNEDAEAVRQEGKRQIEVENNRSQEELQRKLDEKELEVQKHKDIIAFAQRRFDKIIESEACEHDLEIASAKIGRHQEVEKLRQTEAKLRREQDALMKGLEMMEKDRAKSEKEQHEAITEIAKLKMQADELSRTVNSLKVERKEREGTLGEKEKKIGNYQQKINKLKKFRHVLDQQLLEVTETLQPKNHLISQLNQHLQELEFEFERQIKEQRGLEEHTQERMQQIDFLKSAEKGLREQVTERDRIIARFTHDLHTLVTDGREVKLWPAEIRRLYHTYVCGHVDHDDRFPIEEAQRHMRLLEGQVTSLAGKGNQAKATCKVDERRKAHEGAVLIGELNALRVDRQNLNTNIKILEARLSDLKAQLAHEIAEGNAVTDGLPAAMLSASQHDGLASSGTGRSAELRPEGAGGPVARAAPDDDTNSRFSNATVQPPLVQPGASMPRLPSGTTLPGPRQQQSARPASASTSSRDTERRTHPKHLGTAGKERSPTLQHGTEDMTSIESLRRAAAAQHEQLKAHSLENERLREQLQTLRLKKSATKNGAGATKRRAPGLAAS
jgi:WD40 repeat protein